METTSYYKVLEKFGEVSKNARIEFESVKSSLPADQQASFQKWGEESKKSCLIAVDLREKDKWVR